MLNPKRPVIILLLCLWSWTSSPGHMWAISLPLCWVTMLGSHFEVFFLFIFVKLCLRLPVSNLFPNIFARRSFKWLTLSGGFHLALSKLCRSVFWCMFPETEAEQRVEEGGHALFQTPLLQPRHAFPPLPATSLFLLLKALCLCMKCISGNVLDSLLFNRPLHESNKLFWTDIPLSFLACIGQWLLGLWWTLLW